MDKYYRVIFNFDNLLFEMLAQPQLIKSIKIEYMRLRNIACDEINPHYEEWNKEFKKLGFPDRSKDDELYDFGGTEYCNFIRNKQEEIIKSINDREATFVRLCSSACCDIEGEVKYEGKTLTRFNITIKAINK